MLNDTFLLVHSLSKSEKRYFQLNASLHRESGKNQYLRLFDVLTGQKQLNEDEIIKTFRGKNLYLLRRHLFKSILRSLHSFHASASGQAQVFSMIGEADLLHKKGLTKAALKLIYHAKKIALRHELHLALAQLLELEIRLRASSQQLVREKGKIKQAFVQSEKQMDLYRNFQRCMKFRMDIGSAHNKEILFRQPEQQQRFLLEIQELLTKNLSEGAKWQLYNGAGTFYSAIGNHAKGKAYHRKAALISEKRYSPVREEQHEHLLSLYTQGIADYYLRHYDKALENLNELRTVISSLPASANRQDIRELELHSMLLEGFIHMDTGSFDKARSVILQLKKEVNEQGSINVSLRNDIYYQQTGYWFYLGDHKEAQSWISKMLQDPEGPKENPARYRFARMMQLILLLELKEYREMGHILPATRQFLKRKGKSSEIEWALLAFISSYSRAREFHNDKFRVRKFRELKRQLVRLSKNKDEAAFLRMFDYVRWAEARIKNKSMAAIQN